MRTWRLLLVCVLASCVAAGPEGSAGSPSTVVPVSATSSVVEGSSSPASSVPPTVPADSPPVVVVEDPTGVTGEVSIRVVVSDPNGVATVSSVSVVQEFNFQVPEHADEVIARVGLEPIGVAESFGGLTGVSFGDSRFDFVFGADKEIAEYVSSASVLPIEVSELGGGEFEVSFVSEWPGRFPLWLTAVDVDGNATTVRVPVEVYWADQPWDIRGVMIDIHWDGGSLAIADELLSRLPKAGVNVVSLNPVIYSPSVTATEVLPCPERWDDETRCVSPSLADLRHLVETAHRHEMAVFLKPHFIVDGFRHAGWGMSPRDWASWFESYERLLLEMLTAVELDSSDFLIIGNELGSSHSQRLLWGKMIETIRSSTGAQLSYSDANAWTGPWPGSPPVPFWDQLDLVGGAWYYPGSRTNASPASAGSNDPTVADMRSAFQGQLETLVFPTVDALGKRVVFLEMGISNFDGANRFPAETGYSSEMAEDAQEQIDYLEAALQAAGSNSDRVAGGILWATQLVDRTRTALPRLNHEVWFSPVQQLLRVYFGVGAST